LQRFHALWALELIATPAAREILTRISHGTAEAKQTREAITILKRLSRKDP
jgi:hypothetical protein